MRKQDNQETIFASDEIRELYYMLSVVKGCLLGSPHDSENEREGQGAFLAR